MPRMPSAAEGGVKDHLMNVVLPDLPLCVQPSFLKALEADRFPSMPNSFLPASTNKTPGMILLGDAMNMRHPLTGGGMTVAFNDVVLVTALLSPENVPDLEDTEAVLRQMSRFHWDRKALTSVINILAQALYSLFAASGKQPLLSSLPTLLTKMKQMTASAHSKRAALNIFRWVASVLTVRSAYLPASSASQWCCFTTFSRSPSTAYMSCSSRGLQQSGSSRSSIASLCFIRRVS